MTNGPLLRAAIYVRVSTSTQHLDGQRAEVQRLIDQRGWQRRGIYEDQISGVKKRPGLERLLRDCHRGLFDVVVVFAIDRIGRSLSENLNTVLRLDGMGVRVVSVTEPWLDSDGPVRDLLLSIFSWVSQQERARLIERTMVGLERARKAGVVIGRPRVQVDVDRVRVMRAEGRSIRAIAKSERVGAATIHRILAADAVLAGRVPNTPSDSTSEMPEKQAAE